MAKKFKVGDHVTWNSEAGQVSGKITKVHTEDVEFKGHPHQGLRTKKTLDFTLFR